MTIQNIKEKIIEHLEEKIKIIYYGSRNKKEEYIGTLVEYYDNIFILKLINNSIKCFNYSDVLTGNVKIFFDKI